MKDRQILEENLIQNINKIKTKKKLVKEIKDELVKYDILHGDTQGYISNPDNHIPELDARVLYLLTDAVHRLAHNQLGEDALSIVPSDYFTEQEIKESKQFSASLDREDDLEFPMTIRNVTVVGNNAFMATLHIKTIKRLLTSQLLSYNFEVQREAKQIKRDDKIILEPTVNMNNVKEISQHLVEGTLVPTVLVFNAATRTGLDGEELIYDSKKLELTVTKGTRLDIVDGYHRCKGLQNALAVNPDLDFSFAVMITNYSTKRAQQYQAQLAKATKISTSRIQELEAKRHSDTVIQQLKIDSELKGKIKTSRDNRIGQHDIELVSYSILAETIDEEFKMNTNADALDVADYLCDYYDYLIGSFPEYFIDNVVETRKTSLVNNNNIIGIAHPIIARKLQENGIKYRKVKDIVNAIDWSRDNPVWENENILQNGSITDVNKTRKNIKEYFNKLDIKELLGEGVNNG